MAKFVFSFVSFFKANGLVDAMPFVTVFGFVICVDKDRFVGGRELVVLRDFHDGSWL